MEEYDLAKGCSEELELNFSTDVMTGGRDKRMYLYYQLKNSLRRAESVDIIVSFLMESGVKLLLDELENALERGASIRILTGNYLGITQPSALYLIKQKLGERVDLRFYNEKNRSFHPKSYLFHYKEYSELYIGSSNVSKSALTSGIEWNYRFSSLTDSKNYEKFYQTFEDLFKNHSIRIDDEELKRYSKNWHRPAVAKDLDRYDNELEESENKAKVCELYEPRGVQIEALYSLDDTRAEGAKKALVQAATGVGKTYLAAFDSKQYKRVLFVAHREEILEQAARSFANVRKSEDYGFFNGESKEKEAAVIFASVATLGQEKYLNPDYFERDAFDYIVIDEFHHAVTKQYQRIIAYFQPKFLLGLTATPERMDGRDIYEICDYNVPYEISLRDAINKGMLVPFHYYGIYDATDYSDLQLFRGRYREDDLTNKYLHNTRRYDEIYKNYKKYHSRRAIGFCCSKKHAKAMAEEFCKRGVPSVAVYSGEQEEYCEKRDKAIRKLQDEEIRVIFSVDMFNEGVDIASLDMVMFLRPTESPIVFMQQLGRGLRIYKGKRFLNVLDFIGNYAKAGSCTWMLGGVMKEEGNKDKKRSIIDFSEIEYPDDCLVDFDFRLIDLFHELEKKQKTIRERILDEYERIKEMFEGQIPTRMQLFTNMDAEVYEICKKNAKENPFRDYLGFIERVGDCNEQQKQLCQGIGRDFLHVLETTDMSKVYKMPVLYSFLKNGQVRMEVTEEEVLESWKQFFDTGNNWKDFKENITLEQYKAMTDKQHLAKARTMPIKYLKASGKGFFVEKEGYALALRRELKDVISQEEFLKQMKDILEYRTMDYYRSRYERKK